MIKFAIFKNIKREGFIFFLTNDKVYAIMTIIKHILYQGRIYVKNNQQKGFCYS